jgi:hypothetical protein
MVSGSKRGDDEKIRRRFKKSAVASLEKREARETV